MAALHAFKICATCRLIESLLVLNSLRANCFYELGFLEQKPNWFDKKIPLRYKQVLCMDLDGSRVAVAGM